MTRTISRTPSTETARKGHAPTDLMVKEAIRAAGMNRTTSSVLDLDELRGARKLYRGGAEAVHAR